MISPSARRKIIYRRIKVCYRGYKPLILSSGIRKAYNTYMAAVTYLPSPEPSVASSIISINFLAPFLRLASGLPAILPERSRISTISVGLDTISGYAVRDSFTLKEPPQPISDTDSPLFEFVIPILFFLSEPKNFKGFSTIYATGKQLVHAVCVGLHKYECDGY